MGASQSQLSPASCKSFPEAPQVCFFICRMDVLIYRITGVEHLALWEEEGSLCCPLISLSLAHAVQRGCRQLLRRASS